MEGSDDAARRFSIGNTLSFIGRLLTYGVVSYVSSNMFWHLTWKCTVVIFLLHLGQKVFSWVIVKIIIYSLSNIIKYTITRYFNYKNSNYHQEILQKTIQKILLGSTRVWTRDLQIVGPACYKRATQICYCREGFFILLKNVPCAQKIFVLLTSQSWKPEKK